MCIRVLSAIKSCPPVEGGENTSVPHRESSCAVKDGKPVYSLSKNPRTRNNPVRMPSSFQAVPVHVVLFTIYCCFMIEKKTHIVIMAVLRLVDRLHTAATRTAERNIATGCTVKGVCSEPRSG